MGLFSRSKPKIKIQTTKKDGYSGWIKCTHCTELIHMRELEDRHHCCPKCDYHYRLPIWSRIQHLSDEGSFHELFTNYHPVDSLGFVDQKAYPERLSQAKLSAQSDEAVIVGQCTICSIPLALGVMNFAFMGGSMGSVVGEKLTALVEYAIQHRLPVVIVSASGGARMQESTLSLMQMAKISAALAKLSEERLPYISILTNPTTGGVTASFAALGDVILAEPKALICFAGPRVIEQTTGEKLSDEVQKSEFLLKRGMVDAVVPRSELKSRVGMLLSFMASRSKANIKEE